MEYFSKDDVLNLLNRNSITKKITLADGVSIYDSVKNLPTADVVPKSEVEKLNKELEILKKDRYQILENGKIEFLPRTDLKQIKQEVAREIFKEIEKISDACVERGLIQGAWFNKSEFDKRLANLKKKYTESEDKG